MNNKNHSLQNCKYVLCLPLPLWNIFATSSYYMNSGTRTTNEGSTSIFIQVYTYIHLTLLHGIETDDIMYYMFAERCESRLNNVTTFCHHLTLYLSYYIEL